MNDVKLVDISRALREGRRLRVFENRVLRRIFGPKKDEVTGEWRRLHNKELYDALTKYHSGDERKRNETGGACSAYGGEKKCIQTLLGSPEGSRRLERPRRRREDNITMDFLEVGLGHGLVGSGSG
jgi:hypothetical protein